MIEDVDLELGTGAPPRCDDCLHFEDDKCVLIEGNKKYRIPVMFMRADPDGCGPEASWFAPQLVIGTR